jgi:VanZ family protein
MLFSKRQRKLLRCLWALALLLVVAGSLLPASSAPLRALFFLHINDKLLHFLAYIVLAFLPTLHESRPATGLLIIGLIFLGVLLEFGQIYSNGRSFEIADMEADAAGVLCGLLLGLPLRAPGT